MSEDQFLVHNYRSIEIVYVYQNIKLNLVVQFLSSCYPKNIQRKSTEPPYI